MADAPGELHKRIAEIVVERLFLAVAPEEIAPDESLTLKYGVDSVRLFDMVVGMEDDFEITFEDEELTLENFDSLARIAAKVAAKQAGND
ncbi:MAG: acyl carrier protein [Planctomycetes bacterium]|nr:acyl carrier protein [Planctomycetota bacterium]